MTEEDRCLWNRLVQEDGNFNDGGNKLLSYERVFAVKAADALIRSQAEQIEKIKSDHAVQLTGKNVEIANLISERDALAAVVLAAKMQICLHPNGALAAAEINAINNAPAILATHAAALVAPLKSEIVELKEILGLHLENLALTSKAVDTIETKLSEKDAEILRLENSILEADDYRTETGKRDIMRAYRHINAEAAGIREGREKIEREKS